MLYKYTDFQVGNFAKNAVPTFFDRGGLGCPQAYRPLSIWCKNQFLTNRGLLEAGLPRPDSNSDFVVGRPLPNSLKGSIGKYRKRGGLKMNEFKRLQAAGSIILQPLEQMDISYETFPVAVGVGAHSPYSLYSPYKEGIAGSSATYNPCNGYAEPGYITAQTLNFVTCDAVRGPAGSNAGAMWRHYQVFGDYYFHEPSLEDISAIWSEIKAVLDSEWDTGLITSVAAEANSGIIDLYTELAESREIFSWILGLLREAASQYRKVRRSVIQIGNKPAKTLREAAKIQSEINARWLEYRYAVSPLMHSIDDALSLLQSYYSPYQSFRSGQRFSDDLQVGDYTVTGVEIIDRVFLKQRYSHEAWNNNLKQNVVATAWELVPLSFIVDWFLNVGDLISSLSVPSHVAEQNATYSRQIKVNSVITATHQSGSRIVFNGGYYKTTPFDPLIRVGLAAELDMNWKRWLDAFALSWSSVRKLFR